MWLARNKTGGVLGTESNGTANRLSHYNLIELLEEELAPCIASKTACNSIDECVMDTFDLQVINLDATIPVNMLLLQSEWSLRCDVNPLK